MVSFLRKDVSGIPMRSLITSLQHHVLHWYTRFLICAHDYFNTLLFFFGDVGVGKSHIPHERFNILYVFDTLLSNARIWNMSNQPDANIHIAEPNADVGAFPKQAGLDTE